MTTKNTPSPWHVEGAEKIWTVYALNEQGYNRFFATVQPGHAEPMEKTSASEMEANVRLIASAPDLLAEVEREYIELADYTNDWPGRHSPAGQEKLCRLRDLIANATGRSDQDTQDDYGCRAAIAKATGESNG